MNPQPLEKSPKTQPASAGEPPGPPKKTARDLADGSSGEPHIDIPDPVRVSDLASGLRQKPFVIVADLMQLGVFAFTRDNVGFHDASQVARKHGFYARRVS